MPAWTPNTALQNGQYIIKKVIGGDMLTGYFSRDFVGDPWASILRNDPVPIRQRDSSIPEKLAKMIDLALIEKPQIHFQTAAEFKEALLKSL